MSHLWPEADWYSRSRCIAWYLLNLRVIEGYRLWVMCDVIEWQLSNIMSVSAGLATEHSLKQEVQQHSAKAFVWEISIYQNHIDPGSCNDLGVYWWGLVNLRPRDTLSLMNTTEVRKKTANYGATCSLTGIDSTCWSKISLYFLMPDAPSERGRLQHKYWQAQGFCLL